MLRSAALLALVLSGAACGGPGPGDNFVLCHEDCRDRRRCSPGFDDAAEAACHTMCDEKPGCLSDQDAQENKVCRNAPDLRKQRLGCYSLSCDESAACMARAAINPQNTQCQRY